MFTGRVPFDKVIKSRMVLAAKLDDIKSTGVGQGGVADKRRSKDSSHSYYGCRRSTAEMRIFTKTKDSEIPTTIV